MLALIPLDVEFLNTVKYYPLDRIIISVYIDIVKISSLNLLSLVNFTSHKC
jgi:hypothetical protein